MTTVTESAPARAGLLGNPSDGYFGKTLSVSLANFRASVTLKSSSTLCLGGADGPAEEYPDLSSFVRHVTRHGYGDRHRLVKATVKRFIDECAARGVERAHRNFSLRYESDVPRQVGLAGSSAIIISVLRALSRFLRVEIPLEQLPTVALSVETIDLGIEAGLQDRVAQAWGGLVYMDFDRALVESSGGGAYERLSADLLPPLYFAYRSSSEKVSGAVLTPLRARWEAGDTAVIDTLARIAELADEGRGALVDGKVARFGRLMDENFDLRSEIMTISDPDLALVEAARACGVPAKFAGSGGSIVGICDDDRTFTKLASALRGVGAMTVRVDVGSGEAAA